MSVQPTPEQIDALLPQTQCGLCGYKGCMPYAKALTEKKATINLCPPGGVKGLLALAKATGENPEPYLAELEQKAKAPLYAVIREAECIGCTKCIQACPVDAILGTAKLMHSVITDECTGCELCIAPCPVDCIDMIPAPSHDETKKAQFRKRYYARENRIRVEEEISQTKLIAEKQSYIRAALERVKARKR